MSESTGAATPREPEASAPAQKQEPDFPRTVDRGRHPMWNEPEDFAPVKSS